ncbi:hypothetical protein [Acinetobacter nosocomialis]|uniref:hypothetical protein n=1 Tax=Acinetobacter nosocomialis TaxID=106654 RepID=UPI00124FE231|nr:hypothetical protein [Acinetobacter nosocomialis]
MKPEQFIRWFGIEDAKYLIEQNINCNDFEFSLENLKRLVESVDRVNEHGGYLAAKELLSFLIVHQGAFGKSAVSDETINSLKAAIRDHESIYGGSHES